MDVCGWHAIPAKPLGFVVRTIRPITLMAAPCRVQNRYLRPTNRLKPPRRGVSRSARCWSASMFLIDEHPVAAMQVSVRLVHFDLAKFFFAADIPVRSWFSIIHEDLADIV